MVIIITVSGVSGPGAGSSETNTFNGPTFHKRSRTSWEGATPSGQMVRTPLPFHVLQKAARRADQATKKIHWAETRQRRESFKTTGDSACTPEAFLLSWKYPPSGCLFYSSMCLIPLSFLSSCPVFPSFPPIPLSFLSFLLSVLNLLSSIPRAVKLEPAVQAEIKLMGYSMLTEFQKIQAFSPSSVEKDYLAPWIYSDFWLTLDRLFKS